MFEKVMIDLSNQDGSDLSESCNDSRTWISNNYKGDTWLTTLRYFDYEEGFFKQEGFDKESDERHFIHVKQCEKCQNWISSFIDKRVISRKKRLEKYCCPQLFGAVEEKQRGRLQILLKHYSPPHYEGAHNWQLTILDHPKPEGSLLINYCPFCGKGIKIAQ